MNILQYLPKTWKEQLRRRAGTVTSQDRLENLKNAGFSPRFIIDAGAFRGEWAHQIRSIYPAAKLLLIEPQPHLAPFLRQTCKRLGQAKIDSVLLGREESQATFIMADSNSRIVPVGYTPTDRETIVELPIRRLEDVAAENGFAAPDFLKLDLQGHELEALAGAGRMFGAIEVILIEASWIPIGQPPLVAEIISTFEDKGYRLYDIYGFNYRPRDRALWQTDLIFVRLDSPLLASADWA